jgi:hypothetical protein
LTWLWQTPAVVLVVITWLTAPPANLGDLARREALRRELTAKPVERLVGFGTAADVQAPPQTEPPAGIDVTPPPAPPPPPPAPERHDEQWWQDRLANVRAAIERDQLLAEAMQSRINALQTDIVNRDDPFQQAALRGQLQKALAELDHLQKQTETDRKAILDIQEEARRLGVPPGWVR